MVFQRSAVLLLVASAALVSTEALSVGTQSNAITKANKPSYESKPHRVKSPVVHHTKSSHKKQSKQVVVGLPKPVEKPSQKPAEKPQAEDEFEEDSGSGSTGMHDMTLGENEAGVESEDFALPVGGSVDVAVDGANITLKHFANGSVVMYANGKVTVLDGKDIYLDFDVEDEEVGSASGSGHSSGHPKAGEGKEVGSKEALVKAKKDAEGSSVLQKFSEFATKLTGSGKESTPIILIGGAIGALAAVVGIAAVAVRRARGNAAADEPQSMLADGTEDAETSETTTKEEDAAADESDALGSSDSESETEAAQAEGKLMNEDTSV
jgi:hypothetical protein